MQFPFDEIKLVRFADPCFRKNCSEAEDGNDYYTAGITEK
jgi:hypothetical protein